MPLRVLWPHNFDPEKENSGVFMHLLADAFEIDDLYIQKHYLGNLRNPLSLLTAARALRKTASSFDVVHAQFGSACGLVSSAADAPRVLSLRGSDFYFIRHGPVWPQAHGRLANSMTLGSIGRYDRVIVMSRRMKSEVANYVDDCRVEVIPDGVDMQQFRPMPRDQARAMLGSPEDHRPWILLPMLYAGNPIKRPELASEAVRHLKQMVPDVEFKLVSGVSHAQMPLLVNASSAVLLTSTHEGWPNVIKESLSCNVPFVSTDVSDLREIAAEEESCRVVPADPRALADALRHTILMPRSDTLRQRVAHMEKGLVAGRIHEVYKQVTSN